MMAAAGNDTQNNAGIAVATIVGIILTYVSIILAQGLFYAMEDAHWKDQLDKPRADVVEYRKAQAELLESGVKGKTAISIDKAMTTVQQELSAAPATPVAEATEAAAPAEAQ